MRSKKEIVARLEALKNAPDISGEYAAGWQEGVAFAMGNLRLHHATPIDREALGAVIKAHRLAQELTQAELGLHWTMIARYEAGTHCPSRKSLRKIADALGCSVADLLAETTQ